MSPYCLDIMVVVEGRLERSLRTSLARELERPVKGVAHEHVVKLCTLFQAQPLLVDVSPHVGDAIVQGAVHDDHQHALRVALAQSELLQQCRGDRLGRTAEGPLTLTQSTVKVTCCCPSCKLCLGARKTRKVVSIVCGGKRSASSGSCASNQLESEGNSAGGALFA